MTLSQDESRRVSLAEARAASAGQPEVVAAYEQARLRTRREELGLSQAPARRAGRDDAVGIARDRGRRLLGEPTENRRRNHRSRNITAGQTIYGRWL